MKTLSLSEAKMKLSSLVDSVHKTDEEVVITKNGSPAAVLISPDEFEGWKETVAIRSDVAFIDVIKKGLSALKKGKAKLYTLEGLQSIKVGKFRVIYKTATDKRIIQVVAIGPRKTIYEETLRLLQREK